MMKRFLYVDNFRGFTDTYVPVVDVNFLVGENSTGKTSVLGLLQMISSTDFFASTEFGSSHVKFGSFSDIVSAHSNDQSYFRIGQGWEEKIPGDKEEASAAIGFLVTYVRQGVMPYPKRFTYFRDDLRVSLNLPNYDGGNNGESPSVDYKIDENLTTSKPTTLKSLKERVFPEWIKTHSEDPDVSEYEQLQPPIPVRVPITLLLSIVLQKHFLNSSKDKKQRALFFDLMPLGSPARELTWIAPIRTTPMRAYHELASDYSPGGEHTPYVLRRLLESPKNGKFVRSLNSIGNSSGLFETIRTKTHGEDATAPFEVDVVLDGKPLNLCTVGYGVSQSLPVLVEILTRSPETWFAIQQPEVHLHPRAQASLGDVLFRRAVRDKQKFLVETHSDFMIDRFRIDFQKSKKGQKPSSQILFFERKDRQNTVTSLPIDENGELPMDQPDTYRKFFLNEEMQLLRIK